MAAILRSVLSMSAATSLSRITGYARTVVQAAVVGTTLVGSAYTLSNALPTQIFELFVGGLLSSVFVPLLVERLTNHGEEDARRLVQALSTLILPALAALAILGILFAEPLIELTTAWSGSPELSPEQAQRTTDLAVLLFRVFALQIVFYGAGALATAVLNSHRRFFLPTFAPVLNNVLVILSFGGYALLVRENPTAAVYVLAVGTTLGVAVMSLILVLPAWRLGYRMRPRLGHPALASFVRLAGPALLFVAATVGVQLISNLIGSRFDGGVPKLYYAFVVFLLPYGVFVVAIATALTPELSEKYSSDDPEGFRDTLSFGLRTMAFIVVPASVGLLALSQPITALLYQRGEFTPQDTQSVSALLSAYGAGLLGYAACFVLVRSFYSRQDARIPAVLNAGLLVLFVVLAYALSRTVGLTGVALAFSGSYAILAAALLAAMRQRTKGMDGRRLVKSLVKILVAGAAMYAVARGGISLLGTGSGLLERAAILAVAGGGSLAVYLGAALLLKIEELRPATTLLRRRAVTNEDKKLKADG